MGKSYTKFKGHGFWAQDSSLEVWLYLPAREAHAVADQPEWLRVAEKDWLLKASVGFVGCICANLDEHITSTDRQEFIVSLSQQALVWLDRQGPIISATVLNAFNVGGPGSFFKRDVETIHFVRVGEVFVQLLEGNLKTDEKTSPVF